MDGKTTQGEGAKTGREEGEEDKKTRRTGSSTEVNRPSLLPHTIIMKMTLYYKRGLIGVQKPTAYNIP